MSRRSRRVAEQLERAREEQETYVELEVPDWTREEYDFQVEWLLALCARAVDYYGNPQHRQAIELAKNAVGKLNATTMKFAYISYFKIAATRTRRLRGKFNRLVTFCGVSKVLANGALFEINCGASVSEWGMLGYFVPCRRKDTSA